MPDTAPQFKGFEWTGEKRPPKEGEWYAPIGIGRCLQSDKDYLGVGFERFIYRKLEKPVKKYVLEHQGGEYYEAPNILCNSLGSAKKFDSATEAARFWVDCTDRSHKKIVEIATIAQPEWRVVGEV